MSEWETAVFKLIPVEVCLDCKCVYFHNYSDDDCAEKGTYYYEYWKCSECETIYSNNKLIIFEEQRKDLRAEKRAKLQITETNEEEKCCICLDELKICEIRGWHDYSEDNVSLNPCGHTLCGKCNFDLTSKNLKNKCPLCRTQII